MLGAHVNKLENVEKPESNQFSRWKAYDSTAQTPKNGIKIGKVEMKNAQRSLEKTSAPCLRRMRAHCREEVGNDILCNSSSSSCYKRQEDLLHDRRKKTFELQEA